QLKGNQVELIRGLKFCDFTPNRILITSLFTYWSKYVHEAAEFYHKAYPKAKIEIGGIYASLMRKHCKQQSPFASVYRGLYRQGVAEKVKVDYSLLPDNLDYQIIHSSRGCTRRCKFCGTWKIEPEFTFKKSIVDEICSNRLIFYDNNLLANPHIEEILTDLSETQYNRRVVYSESQCGIDGRLLTPKLARLLKKARFINPRIAWDGPYNQAKHIKAQIDMLTEAGYNPKNIYVFMVYNYDLDYYEMKKKLSRCKKWGVQIADCRFRPLDQPFDNYNPRLKQTNNDYYIHPDWSDRRIRLFRRKVREQNIIIRHGFDSYSRELERLGAKKKQKTNL
ncbi:MAG: radical SAM protein, partial [Phycisphaerales bacterium]